MHRYSLIKLICRDSLFQSVLNSFMPSYQNTRAHTHIDAVHPHSTTFSLAAPQSTEMPRSSQNVTPNYFLISLKQLFPIQHNRSLIGDTKRRRRDSKQPTTKSWDDTPGVGGGVKLSPGPPLPRSSFVSWNWNWARRGYPRRAAGFIYLFFFFNWLQLIMAKEKTHTQFVLYSSSCACESNLLHRDNRKSEATVRSLFPPLFIISSLFTCLSSSSSFSHRSRPGSEGFNFPPARKRHCNYTSCFTELAGDNSLYAYRSGPPIKTHLGSPIISSRPGDLLLTSVHLFICRLPSRSRAFSGPPLPLPSAGQHVWLEAGDSIYRRRVSPLRRSRAGLPARLQNPAMKLSTRSRSWVQVRLLHYPRRWK